MPATRPQTPLTSLALTGILAEAGVLNVVTTSGPGGVVGPWMRSGIARKICVAAVA